MRISTAQFYSQSVQSMDNQQSELNQLYQEISTGKSLLTPADNPVGAAQAVQLTLTSETLTQYTTNQNSALSALQLEDKTLQSVTSVMASIKSLITQAGDGSLTDSQRGAIAKTMEGYRSQLLSLANTSDSNGSYVFSGFQSKTAPFTNNASGGVTYLGDNGAREVQVANTTTIATNDSGANVFLTVPGLGTSPVAASSPLNTGNGTITQQPVVTNPSAISNSDSYTITIGGTSAAPTYTIADASPTGGTTTTGPFTYTAGAAIPLGTGMSVTLSGNPNPSDTFTVTPSTASQNSSLFTTIDSIISALQTPTSGSGAAGASLANALSAGTVRFQNSLSAITVVQASVGGREQQLNALQTVTQTNSVQTQSNLSNVTDIDMTSVISQYELQQTSLQAAQQSFVKIQGMSLFQYL
jgi:flagellar hook-associated protein 3 FlgL